ncbi:MAG: hypothetical protein ACJ735_01600 [Actinomycetes bacterium]
MSRPVLSADWEGHEMGHCPPIDVDDYLAHIEREFSGDPAIFLPKLEEAIVRIGGGRPLTDLAKDRFDSDAAEHLGSHWLAEWWPEQQPVEPILRQGLVEALTLAWRNELPVQALMVTGDGRGFQVAVVHGASQVTMIIMAPPPPPETIGRRSDRITLVRREGGEVIVD